jgi:hypothetical protein
MPECPVCRREFDARFQVFASGGREGFDTLECARRATRTAGADEVLAPLLLPTIELLPIARPPAVAPLALFSTTRRRLAAAVAVPLVASPTAIAAGLSLVAAGTATSLYLWSPALDKVGQVVAAPALPLQPSGRGGDTSEGHAPPSFSLVTGGAFSPVTGGTEEEAKAAGIVAADEVAEANSGANEDAPTVTAAAAPSSIASGDPPVASDGRPVSPGEASPPHLRPPPLAPAGPRSHPSAPPPTTTAPPDAAGESPSPPPAGESPPAAPSPRTVTGSPAAVTEEPSTGKQPKPKPKPKKGATPAVPADGKKRRDEPKPRPSPAAIPAVPASEHDTSEAGDGGSDDSVGSGGSHGTTGEERGNGNGNANGNGNGNGHDKTP